MSLDEKLNQFVRQAFVDNPHHSFGDWTIMYNHSKQVADLTKKISESIKCDSDIALVEAWLHDVGKAYKADSLFLHEHHAIGL